MTLVLITIHERVHRDQSALTRRQRPRIYLGPHALSGNSSTPACCDPAADEPDTAVYLYHLPRSPNARARPQVHAIKYMSDSPRTEQPSQHILLDTVYTLYKDNTHPGGSGHTSPHETEPSTGARTAKPSTQALSRRGRQRQQHGPLGQAVTQPPRPRLPPAHTADRKEWVDMRPWGSVVD